MSTDLEARVRELENTVRELRDREAIRDLRYRYHEYVNEGKFAEIPGLFTTDGVLDFAHTFNPSLLNSARIGASYFPVTEGYTNATDTEKKILNSAVLAAR